MGIVRAPTLGKRIHSEPAFGHEKTSPGAIMRYLETVEELPTLSAVAMRINTMLQDMDTTANELANVIENDQAIVSKLLKLANSSFFGFSTKVSSTAHAVMILGLNAAG